MKSAAMMVVALRASGNNSHAITHVIVESQLSARS